jgi:sugar lactone lactonase YvrE
VTRTREGRLFATSVALLLVVIVGLVALWPALALGIEALFGAQAAGGRASTVQFIGGPVDGGGALAVLLRSLAWSLGAAGSGALLGWAASRALPRVSPRALRVALSLAVLLPIALPPWLLYAGIWLSVGPGTPIGDFAERSNAVSEVRTAILALSLVAWCAAPAFAALSARSLHGSSGDTRLADIDGLHWGARLRAAWSRDWRLLLVSVVATAAFLLGETTAFDLAFIPTFGFELRSMDALGAPAGRVLAAALPAIALAVLGLALVAWMTRATRVRGLRDRARQQPEARPTWTALLAVALPAAIVLTPVVLFARALFNAPRLGDFLVLHGRALVSALVVAAIAALVVSLAAVALRAALASPRGTTLRRLGAAATVVCALASLVPGTVVAVALEAGYNHHASAFVYDTPLIVVCTLAARALAVAAVVAVALDGREPQSARNLRALDGGRFGARVRGLRAELVLAGFAAFPVALAWSLGELTASGRVIPPGFQWIATDILNAIHYQRPETVLFGAAALLAAAILAIVGVRAVVVAVGRHAPRAAGFAMLAALAVGMTACDRPSSGPDGARSADGLAGVDDANAPTLAGKQGGAPGEFDVPMVARGVPVEVAFGVPGRGRGQFNGPRVLAADPTSGDIYVIDKDARVQRFDREGRHICEWPMPAFARGKPVGGSVGPDGSFVVADTHEHRFVAYSPTGEIRWTLGSYGLGLGEFIYPTDAAFAPDGRMFVAEYGGNDRIQVFDRERKFLYAFGRAGSGPVEFLRPQSIIYDAERDELYIADVGNHRIQVVTGDGEFRRAIGRPGTGEGQFAYPFGLVLEIGGVAVTAITEPHAASAGEGGQQRTIVVAEHGNHRVQRLDAETGAVLGVLGGLGAGGGRLKYPWALEPAGIGARGGQRFAVCDHGNARIVLFEFPRGQ